MNNYFGGHMFSFILGIYLRVGLLGHMVTLHLIFWETARQYLNNTECIILHSYHQCMRVLIFPVLPTLVILCYFDYSHHSGFKWYRIVVLICIFLMINDFYYVFYGYLYAFFDHLYAHSHILYFYYWVLIVFL